LDCTGSTYYRHQGRLGGHDDRSETGGWVITDASSHYCAGRGRQSAAIAEPPCPSAQEPVPARRAGPRSLATSIPAWPIYSRLRLSRFRSLRATPILCSWRQLTILGRTFARVKSTGKKFDSSEFAPQTGSLTTGVFSTIAPPWVTSAKHGIRVIDLAEML